MCFLMITFFNFGDFTCFRSMGGGFEMNLWTQWTKSNKWITYNWILFYSMMNLLLIISIACLHYNKTFTYQKCIAFAKKTFYALLICFFYFEFANIIDSIWKKQYHCCETIRCHFSKFSIVKLLKIYNVMNLFFHIDVEILKYYKNEFDLCTSCHQY